HNITLESISTIEVTGPIIQISGSISNSRTFTATSGSIVFNGTSAQTIPAETFSSNTVKDLTINDSAGVTLSGTLGIINSLTVSSGNLATGGYLTLRSNSSGTARVTNSAGTITGDVTVERYIPSKRAWRLLTAPVS